MPREDFCRQTSSASKPGPHVTVAGEREVGDCSSAHYKHIARALEAGIPAPGQGERWFGGPRSELGTWAAGPG